MGSCFHDRVFGGRRGERGARLPFGLKWGGVVGHVALYCCGCPLIDVSLGDNAREGYGVTHWFACCHFNVYHCHGVYQVERLCLQRGPTMTSFASWRFSLHFDRVIRYRHSIDALVALVALIAFVAFVALWTFALLEYGIFGNRHSIDPLEALLALVALVTFFTLGLTIVNVVTGQLYGLSYFVRGICGLLVFA